MADTPAGGAISPPGIGEALGAGWNAFKPHMGPALLAYLCAYVVALIPVVGGFWATAGFFNVSLKLVRGQKPNPGDGFVAFEKGLVDHLVMGLLQILGLIACCIGVYVTQALFFPGTFLILDKGMTWQQAKDQCMARVKPALLSWFIFFFVVGIVGGLGVIVCFVGILFTLPIAFCAMAYAYDKTLAASVAKV